jgi:arginase
MERFKFLNIPFDYGQDHPGVRFAGTYLREAGLLNEMRELSVTDDLGDMDFPLKLSSTVNDNIKNLHEASAANREISEAIEKLDLGNDFLLNVGGDHGMSLGTIHGILSHRPDSVVIWADAHGDINTPDSTPSGNFHGMPLAFLTGIANHSEFNWIENKLSPEKLILIGPRDLDEGEKNIIEKYKIQYFSSEELNRIGAKEVLEMALHRADPHGICPIHLSFDVDLFDGSDVLSTGTVVPDGPKLEEIFLLGGLVAETGRLKSMDLVEFNPLIGKIDDVNASGELIMDFVLTTLKQKGNRDFIHRAFGSALYDREFA